MFTLYEKYVNFVNAFVPFFIFFLWWVLFQSSHALNILEVKNGKILDTCLEGVL